MIFAKCDALESIRGGLFVDILLDSKRHFQFQHLTYLIISAVESKETFLLRLTWPRPRKVLDLDFTYRIKRLLILLITPQDIFSSFRLDLDARALLPVMLSSQSP